MDLVQVHDITINHAGRDIFQDLSWSIGDRDHVGLIGPNGAGKTSLLRAIVGDLAPTAGAITRARRAAVGYLNQHVEFAPGRTLIEEAMVMPGALAAADADLTAIEARLADPAVYGDGDALTRALAAQEAALARFNTLGGDRFASRIRELLALFGFTPDQHDLPSHLLSGGQKKLIMLARLAAQSPDLLLLDEPDNHLDLAAKARLEKFLSGYAGAFILISHDRYLLDETVTSIAELDAGKLTLYPGSYSRYALEREAARARQLQMYISQQKRVTQIETAIKQFDFVATTYDSNRAARQARSRRKMLERMETNGELIDRPQEARTITLQFDGGRGSTRALDVRRLAMAFDDDLLFADLDLLVQHGERVGVVGRNGAGKSVLFKLLTGELTPFAGEVRFGPSTRMGYYAQEHQTLAGWWDRTPIDFIRDYSRRDEASAVNLLLKLLFTYEQTRLPIRSMSGGERSRLQIAALMLQRPNLLLLDEPTNNLDIASSEALETALEDFDGALLVISHDRYFVDRVVDRVVELKDGAIRAFAGGYTDYLHAANRPPAPPPAPVKAAVKGKGKR